MPARKLDSTPDTFMLRVMHENKLGWSPGLSELIDNGFDADANHIEIRVTKDTLTVKDDGNGCCDMEAMTALGNHKSTSKTRLGRHGVGLKDMAIWLWGKLMIRSLSGGRIYLGDLDWEKMAHGGWQEGSADDIPATPQLLDQHRIGGRGTVLRFTRMGRRFANTLGVLADLSYNFWPAIGSGKTITLWVRGKRHDVPLFQSPPMEKLVERHGTAAGRGFLLKCGIVSAGHPNPKAGFTIAYRHRVLYQTAAPCGSYGCARFFGYVLLDGDWPLSRNKNQVSRDQDKLEEAVAVLARDIVREASQQAKTLDLEGIADRTSDRLSQMISKGLRTQKEKRQPPSNPSGAVEPKKTGTKRRKARRTQTGATLESLAGRGIKVEFVDGSEPIGCVRPSNEITLVHLAKDHPAVREALAQDSDMAITLIAAPIVAAYAAHPEDGHQSLMPFLTCDTEHQKFLEAMTICLQVVGGVPVEELVT